MSTTDRASGNGRNARQDRAVARRLVRRLGAERAKWAKSDGVVLATDTAWRRGVYEGLRLAQVEIRRGV